MSKFKSDFHKKRFKKYLKNPFKADSNELDKAKELYEIEYKWWGDKKPFQTNQDIKESFQKDLLVEVKEDENIKPIMRLQNPEMEQWLPYLDKDTNNLLIEIGNKWRKELNKENISKEIKLAITSLTRSVEYQKKIVEEGKLAVENSSHTKGKSFDIDGCGYYEGDTAINPRFTDDYDKKYNSSVHKILESILKNLKEENKLNYIPEYVDTDNQCFHVTVAPKK